jgi:predicted DNA-binding protein with PD1-like motif
MFFVQSNGLILNMKFKQFGNKYIIRIEKGEEIVETLKQFCKEQNINLGSITGLGATNKAVLGLFKTESKEYKSNEFNGDFEITSLVGNISEKDGEIYLHIHANIGNEDGQVFGGHLSSAVVSATFEGVIDKIEGNVNRYFEKGIGLYLLEL